MHTDRYSAFHRAMAGVLMLTLCIGPLGSTAYAQMTPLADVPIAAKVAAKPNIVYSLDDSGSMNLSVIVGNQGTCHLRTVVAGHQAEAASVVVD